MNRTSSRFIIIIGVATLLLGTALLLLLTRGSGDDAEPSKVATNPSDRGGTAAKTSPAPAGAPAVSTNAEGVPNVEIPEGRQALAVQLAYVPGLAGYAKAGDQVNVYATVKNGAPGGNPKPPLARLVLSNIDVLAVTAPGPGAGTGNTTYLLSLDPRQVEQVIFLQTFESLHFSLVPKGQAPVPTPGRSYENVL